VSDHIHIVCPRCAAINRMPAGRRHQQPRCGKCHGPLFDARPVDLTTATFAKHVEKTDIPVLVDFWAPWCGFCRKMAPAFEQAATILEPAMRLARVNTEAEQTLAALHAVNSLPTLILFRDGREIARQPGAMGTDDIVNWARGYS
jgi:thioredoxin 2